jgi:hypothetical protein
MHTHSFQLRDQPFLRGLRGHREEPGVNHQHGRAVVVDRVTALGEATGRHGQLCDDLKPVFRRNRLATTRRTRARIGCLDSPYVGDSALPFLSRGDRRYRLAWDGPVGTTIDRLQAHARRGRPAKITATGQGNLVPELQGGGIRVQCRCIGRQPLCQRRLVDSLGEFCQQTRRVHRSLQRLIHQGKHPVGIAGGQPLEQPM